VFGYSTRDYLLRSIDPMFWPLVVGLVAALAALSFHVWLVSWATEASARDRRHTLKRFALVVGWGGVVAIVVGAVASRLRNPSRLVFMAVPLVLTVGVVLTGYALHVRRRFVLRRRPVALSTAELTQLRLAASSLMVLLLFVSLFWSVQRYAYVKGGDLARQLVRDLAYRPDVTIYSAKRLQLASPVTETDLGGDSAEYRFRYTGLKLLFKSDGRYFLRPTDETSPLNIVVADASDLRFEFTGGYG
jgi:cytochrome bd-type quinol oxidase subunit 2